MLRNLIPDLVLNYKHPKLLYYLFNKTMEFDFWSSSLNLAIEYQGEQHYMQSTLSKSREIQLQLDEEKRQTCEQFGVSLVAIPYWWNGTLESLIDSICKVRPDIFRTTVDVSS